MKKLYAGLALLCALASSNSMANEADAWTQAYQFPHFTREYAGCENVALAQMKKLFEAQGLPASAYAEMSESYFAERSAHELVRPFVQGDSVLIGLNMRWLGNPICRNPVLSCQPENKGNCSEISFVGTNEVLRPLLVNEQTIIAERDNFTPRNLNPGQPDFVSSSDKGKSWTRINSPVSCSDLGTRCMLFPKTALSYFLMHTKLINDVWTDIAIHSTADGGKSWTLLTEKWKGMHDPSAVSFANDTFASLERGPGEFVTLSRLKPLENKFEELKTSISTGDWSPRYDGKVLEFEGGYLVRLNAANGAVPANHFGVFFVPSAGDPAAAKLIWQVKGVAIRDFQSAEGVIAIRTWDPKSLVERRKFAEQLHFSLDAGKTWKVYDVPPGLLGAEMRLANRKIWLFTPNVVKYRDLSK